MKSTFRLLALACLTVAAVLLAPTAEAQSTAQPFTHASFFNSDVSSVVVSNTIAYTNTLSVGLFGTNVTGLLFTRSGNTVSNQPGVFTNSITLTYGLGLGYTVGTATTNYGVFTNTYGSYKIMKDVPLFGDGDGVGWPIVLTNNSTVHATAFQTPACINIKLVAGNAAANSAVTFTFVPVPDGTNESTATGDQFICAVTANGTTVVDNYFPVPMYKYAGCKALRLKSVVNADTDALSAVYALDISLNAFGR